MHKPLITLCLVITTCLHAQQVATVRTWTSTDGKAIPATFISSDGTTVTLKLANGAVVPVPLARLSTADQAFAKEAASAATPAAPGAAASTDSDQPLAEKEWPRIVALEEKPKVTVVKEDAATKEFIYRSDHYEFVCDSKLGANVVSEFKKVFEATWLLNCKLPLDLKPKPEKLRDIFQARLYTVTDDYMKAGGVQGSAGIYMSSDKALKVPLKSLGVKMVGSRVSLEKNSDDDNVTLIHEITHQMMNHWLRDLPTWYIEGAAEYVEQQAYERGKFNLAKHKDSMRDYANRMGGDGKSFTMRELKSLLTINGREWMTALGEGGDARLNYGSAGMLTYYFYHLDGKGDAANIIACLRAIEGGMKGEEAFAKHLLRERTPEQLQEEVQKAFRGEGIKIEFVAGKTATTSAQ